LAVTKTQRHEEEPDFSFKVPLSFLCVFLTSWPLDFLTDRAAPVADVSYRIAQRAVGQLFAPVVSGPENPEGFAGIDPDWYLGAFLPTLRPKFFHRLRQTLPTFCCDSTTTPARPWRGLCPLPCDRRRRYRVQRLDSPVNSGSFRLKF
jgi:hypothetical protein